MHRILVVDDYFNTRLLFQDLLENNGYEVVGVSNGKKAIDAIVKDNQFSLVIMDIEMPVMNGLETTEYIRKKLKLSKKKLPIIALSAHYVSETKKKYENIGFNGFLSKPVDISNLFSVLKDKLNAKKDI